MHVLVTGGAGFIGTHTVDALLGRGHEVTVLDALLPPVHPPERPADLPRGVHFIQGDIRDPQAVRRALEGVEAVYHFAAYQDYLPDLSRFFAVNAVGTALLYEIMVNEHLSIRKVVVASSQSVQGEGLWSCREHGEFVPRSRPKAQLERGEWDVGCPWCGNTATWKPTPETVAKPQNQYGLSKHSQELMALAFGERFGIPTVILRYSIVQGPRQSPGNAYSGVCRIFCLAYAAGVLPTAFEDGQSMRDYVNIQDVVAANMLVLEQDEAVGQVFNVGGGRAYSVAAFGRIVAEVYGSSELPRVVGDFRFGDTRHAVANIDALQALGWSPGISPEETVRDYAEWLATQDLSDGRQVLDRAESRMRALGIWRRAQSRE